MIDLAPRRAWAALLAAACLATAPASGESDPADSGGLGGGGPLGVRPAALLRSGEVQGCIPEAERAAALERAERFEQQWEAEHGMTIAEALGVSAQRTAAPFPYTFFPMGGTLFRDIFFNNYVDLGAGSSVLDWDCTDWSYDTHRGHDMDLRSFGEQEVGVPIFAELDGIVSDWADGHPDMVTTGGPAPANYVVLNHGSGHRTLYWHMKNGSVAVINGQQVKAGEQIGLVASSGFSTGPHLHFETQVNSVHLEPFAGSCNPGASNWVDQQPIDRSIYVRDAGITHINMATVQGLPHELPRDGQLALGDSLFWFWLNLHNMPASSTYQFKFRRPNGTLNPFQPTGSFGANPFYRWSWWWFGWNVTEMHSITGTWTVEFFLNGELIAALPVEVRQERTPDFNRPPNDINSAAFDPPSPEPGGVVFCRLDHDLVNDDPDYDIVRYRYVWTINGNVVRDVVSAGHSDAIRAGLTQVGQTLRCDVTPSDGDLDGNPVSVMHQFVAACPGDVNGDNVVDTADLGAMIGVFGTASVSSDLNGDGVVDTADLGILIGAFGTNCN